MRAVRAMWACVIVYALRRRLSWAHVDGALAAQEVALVEECNGVRESGDEQQMLAMISRATAAGFSHLDAVKQIVEQTRKLESARLQKEDAALTLLLEEQQEQQLIVRGHGGESLERQRQLARARSVDLYTEVAQSGLD